MVNTKFLPKFAWPKQIIHKNAILTEKSKIINIHNVDSKKSIFVSNFLKFFLLEQRFFEIIPFIRKYLNSEFTYICPLSKNVVNLCDSKNLYLWQKTYIFLFLLSQPKCFHQFNQGNSDWGFCSTIWV